MFALVIPATQNIQEGYQKDFNTLMSQDQTSSLDPEVSSMKTFVTLTPNGSKAVVNEVNGFESFVDNLILFVAIILIAAGVIVYLNFKVKAKEQAERNRRMQMRFNAHSRRNSGAYSDSYYYKK
jgi:hypothetical protein